MSHESSESDAGAPPFPLILDQFKSTLDGLIEVLEATHPHVANLDAREFRVTLPEPPEDGAEILREFFEQGRESQSDAEPLDFADAVQRAYAAEPETLRRIGRTILQVVANPPRGHLLYGSLLVVAVGAIETAVAGVLGQHFVLHPDSLGSQEKEFSLADLEAIEDVAEARNLAITRRVDDLMRNGFEDWDRRLGKLLDVSFEQLANDYGALSEAIQRRHLVVHNAGKVSRQYLVRTDDQTVSVGDRLLIAST